MFDVQNDTKPWPRLRPLHIGPERIEVPVLLAPMAGVTDQPYRRLVRSFGAGLVFSEMIASQAMIREVKKTLQMIEPADKDDILAVQLAGSDPLVMAEAARLNADRGARILDINFGCPAKKIVNNLAGSALMRDEVTAAKILEAVVRAVNLPVTLKMRLGWDAQHINAPRLATLAQESGIQMITVHGRTRSQFYRGQADWAAVRAVKESVRLPVIVNGDIHDEASMMEALRLSGADGVMIGRASYGRPWLLRQMMDYLETGAASPAPSLAAQYDIIRAHFDAMLETYGTYGGIRIARKHLAWYSKGWPQAAAFRAAVNQATQPDEVMGLLARSFLPLMEGQGEDAL